MEKNADENIMDTEHISGRARETDKEIWRAGNMLYPLPAVMVSCAMANVRPNIITVAWAGTVCTDPPMVSISIRPGRYSHDIIEKSGEFVINLVTEDLIRACDWCGVVSGREHDKFSFCGFEARPAEGLEFAPLIAQSPVNIACRVEKKLELGSHDMFLARVVSVHVDRAGLDESGRYDLGKMGLTAYSHGEYFALGKKLGSFGYSVKRHEKKNSEDKKHSDDKKYSKGTTAKSGDKRNSRNTKSSADKKFRNGTKSSGSMKSIGFRETRNGKQRRHKPER